MLVSKHIEIIVVFLASLLAIYVGSHVVLFSIPMLSILVAFIFTLIWALTAGRFWWLPVLSGAVILGVFQVGAKFYPTEIGLALAITGLIPLILVQNKTVFQKQRRPLPLIFYLTGGYILARMMVDIIPLHGSERLNLTRSFFDAFWPFIFGFVFHRYGSLSVLRAAVTTAFILLVIRSSASLAGYLSNIPLVIPGINYVLSFSDADSLLAMRSVALSLLSITLVYYHETRSYLSKAFFFSVMLLSEVLVIMGSSRFATLMMFILPIVFFAWSRHWLLLAMAAVIGFGIISSVNIFPHMIDPLPPVAQRSLSGLMVTDDHLGLHEETKGSDEWHDALKVEGYSRWTQSPLTLLFGYGVRPSPDLYESNAFSVDQKTIIEIAANVGSYEAGLWTVLAVLGSVGMTLYFCLFYFFWKETYPYIFRRPIGTFWEGMIFWGFYTSVLWFVVANYQGKYPSLELILMILAWDIVQDGKMKEEEEEITPELATPMMKPLLQPAGMTYSAPK